MTINRLKVYTQKGEFLGTVVLKEEKLIVESDNDQDRDSLEKILEQLTKEGVFSRKSEAVAGKIREFITRATIKDLNFLQILKDNLVMSGFVVISG